MMGVVGYYCQRLSKKEANEVIINIERHRADRNY